MKLVLKPTSNEMDVRLIASINHWQIQADIPADASTPWQIIWMLPEGDTRVIYVEDSLLRINYLVVEGSREVQVAELVQKGLEVYDSSDIDRLRQRDMDPAEAEKLVSVMALLAMDRFDREIYTLFSIALEHPAVSVRRAAVFAITYAPWQPLRNLLWKRQDEDSEIRPDIEVILKSIDQHGWLVPRNEVGDLGAGGT